MDSVQNNFFKSNPSYHENNKRYPYSIESQEQTDESIELSEELSDGVFDKEMLLTISEVNCTSGQILKLPKIVEVKEPSEKLRLPQFKRRQNYFLKLNDIVAESNQSLADVKKYADLKAKIVRDSKGICKIEQGRTMGIQKCLPESWSKVNWYNNEIQQISTEEKLKPIILVADPNYVFFRNYRAGNTYKSRVKVCNVSNHPCRFSILPLSKHTPFSIQWKCRAGYTKLLAPGNFIDIVITFCCVLNEDYCDQLLIRVENGEDLNIPIKAYLIPPYLKESSKLLSLLPIHEETRCCTIECGRVLLGDTNETVLRLRNNGCDARFWILSEDSWYTLDIKDTDTQNTVHMETFALRPTYFYISSYNVIDLHIQFTPACEGFHLVRAVMLCDNHSVKTLDLFGEAYLFNFTWIQFKDVEKTFCIDIPDDESSEWYLDLGIIQCGTCKTREVEIHNSGCIHLSCHWDIKDIEISGTLPVPADSLYITPQDRSLCSKSTCKFAVTCKMENVNTPGKYRAVVSLIIDEVPRKSIAVCDKVKIVHANDDEGIVSVEVGRMEIWVECAFPVLSINPWIVIFSDDVCSDGTDKQSVTVTNCSSFPVCVQWINPQHDSFIKIEPNTVSIEENSSAEFSLSLSALCEGNFRQVLLCIERSSDTFVELLVTNQVNGRDVVILTRSLDFGLVKQNSHHVDYLLLKKTTNDQNVWSLKEYKFNTDKNSRGILTRIYDPDSCTSAVEGCLCHEGSIACVSYVLDTKNKGIWCSLLEWVVNGKSISIPVIADIQTTNILMDKIVVNIGEPLYLNIPVKLGVTLQNHSLLPTYVKWQKSIGDFKNNVIVTVVPSETVIVANSACQFSLHIVPMMLGIFRNLIIPCEVELQSKPLFLSVSGEVYGLSVTFKWQIASQDVEVAWSQAEEYIEESNSNSTSQHSSELTMFRVSDLVTDSNDIEEELMKCELSEMDVMKSEYTETNTLNDVDSIPYLNWPVIGGKYTRARMEESFYELIFAGSVNGDSKKVCTFPSAPQFNALIFDNIPCRQPITQTFYINNKSSIPASFSTCVIMYKAADLSETKSLYSLLEQIQMKLSTNKSKDTWFERVDRNSGIAMSVNPSTGTLPGNDYVCVSVTVYAHTWGCYNTAITVQVGNLVPFPLRLIATVHSSPISVSQTFVRFGNVLYRNSNQSRTLTVQNNSYLCVYIIWQIFLKSVQEKEYAFKLMLIDNNNFNEPPFSLFLTPYYGSYCSDLFQINEECTLLEPWSSAAVDIIFNPEHYIIDVDFHKRSADLHGTLVGHVFLTHDSRLKSDAKNCIHYDGAELEPVEIGITVSVHIPKLVMLNCEPSDLCFKVYPYDVMTNVNRCLDVSKSIRLGNTSKVVADMMVKTTPPFDIKSVVCLREANIGLLTKSNIILQQSFVDTSNLVLQPGEVCDIEIEFTLTEENMRDIFTEFVVVNSDEEVDAFQIHKGALKFVEDKSLMEDTIDLEIQLYQSILIITKEFIQFGRVFVSETKEEFFYITSKTGRDEFKLELVLGKESPFSVKPEEGILEPNKPIMIAVTFKPGESIYYKDEVIIHNCILDNIFRIILDGFGVLDYKEHCLNYVVDDDSYKNTINNFGQQLTQLGSAFIFD